MKKLVWVLSAFPFLLTSAFAGQNLEAFISAETGGKLELSGSTVSYPPGTNVLTKGDDKIYSTSKVVGGKHFHEMVVVKSKPGTLNRISILKDEDYQDGKVYYVQSFSTLSVEDGRPTSMTNCDLNVNRERYNNKDYRDGNYNGFVHDMVWGTPSERLFGSCYTVTDSICDELKKGFADPDFKKIKNEMKSCQTFADKFSKTITGEKYFDDEAKAEENIKAMSEAWETMNYNPKSDGKVKSSWASFYNNLNRGERESFAGTVKKFGKMISLCEKLKFQPKQSVKTEQDAANKAK